MIPKERVLAALHHKETDRIPYMDNPWETTLERWRKEGGNPRDMPVVSYQNNKVQKDFLSNVWFPIAKRMIHTVTEVQNNNPRTPIKMQIRFQLAAILETMEWMMKNE